MLYPYFAPTVLFCFGVVWVWFVGCWGLAVVCCRWFGGGFGCGVLNIVLSTPGITVLYRVLKGAVLD